VKRTFGGCLAIVATSATLRRPTGLAAVVFSRKNIGEEPQRCAKCGAEKVYFVQHSHGNYPILDYVCPRCDLGGEEGIPDWFQSPTGHEEPKE
jgi:hypothetical protein